MAVKRAAFTPAAVRVSDNVPPGMAVSLDGLAPALSFASMFRDELMARGFGVPKREVRRGQKSVV